MKYCIRCFVFFFKCTSRRESFIWRRQCFSVNPDVSFVHDRSFVCVRTWMESDRSDHLTCRCPDEIWMTETFLSPDKPQLECVLFSV